MPGLFPVGYGGGVPFPPIDELPDADTPLVGDEFVAVSQDGEDKKVTVDNFTIGRNVEMSNLELTGGEITVPDPSGLSVNTDWYKIYKNSGVLNIEYLLDTGTPQTVFIRQLFNIGTGSGQFFQNACTSYSVNSAEGHFFTTDSVVPDALLYSYAILDENTNSLVSSFGKEGETSDVLSAGIYFGNSLHPISALLRSRGSINSAQNVQNGDVLGEYAFYGRYSGTVSNQKGATIRAVISSAPGIDDMPTDLLFMTSPNGTRVPTEKMRIKESGLVGIGTSSPSSLLDVAGRTRTRNLNAQLLSITSAAGNTVLTSSSPTSIVITGTSPQNLTLPDARTLQVGDIYFVTYTTTTTSTCSIFVASVGSSVSQISPAGTGFVMLTLLDNSTLDGVWSATKATSASSNSTIVTRNTVGGIAVGSITCTSMVSTTTMTAARAIITRNEETLAANKTIASTDPQYQFLNPGGSNRDVTLPAAITSMQWMIKNTGNAGNTLTVKDNGGVAVPGGVIANGVIMGFYYTGGVWQLV